MNEKFEKIKSLIVKKTEKNNKKTIENLFIFVIILVVTIIAINLIWKEDKNTNKSEKNYSTNLNIAENVNKNINEISNKENDIEIRLEDILSKINGVGKVNVLVTYSSTNMIIPLYNEDTEESLTEENDKEGGTRKITENKSKKDIIYQELSGEKKPITQSVISPKIEGAIITAEGAGNAETKSKIIQAVEAVTSLATHKIQVFEMKK